MESQNFSYKSSKETKQRDQKERNEEEGKDSSDGSYYVRMGVRKRRKKNEVTIDTNISNQRFDSPTLGSSTSTTTTIFSNSISNDTTPSEILSARGWKKMAEAYETPSKPERDPFSKIQMEEESNDLLRNTNLISTSSTSTSNINRRSTQSPLIMPSSTLSSSSSPSSSPHTINPVQSFRRTQSLPLPSTPQISLTLPTYTGSHNIGYDNWLAYQSPLNQMLPLQSPISQIPPQVPPQIPPPMLSPISGYPYYSTQESLLQQQHQQLHMLNNYGVPIQSSSHVPDPLTQPLSINSFPKSNNPNIMSNYPQSSNLTNNNMSSNMSNVNVSQNYNYSTNSIESLDTNNLPPNIVNMNELLVNPSTNDDQSSRNINITHSTSSGSASEYSSKFTSFVLTEQPSYSQRKSYKKENRYLTPNPLVIAPRSFLPSDDPPPRIIDGIVSVKLVGPKGEELPSDRKNILESVEGIVQKLDSNNTASFSLKIMQTSDGENFCLLFTIVFTVEGVGSREEKILSNPFVVCSNIRKAIKDVPKLAAIKDQDGYSDESTEVWIKGYNFNEKVVVKFGDHLAKITECSPNLIIAIAPPRPDLLQDTQVQVELFNKYGSDLVPSDQTLYFLYKKRKKGTVSSKPYQEWSKNVT